MVKRFYIQDYSENFRGNTKRRTMASEFNRTSIESSLTRRDKKTHIRQTVVVSSDERKQFLKRRYVENQIPPLVLFKVTAEAL